MAAKELFTASVLTPEELAGAQDEVKVLFGRMGETQAN